MYSIYEGLIINDWIVGKFLDNGANGMVFNVRSSNSVDNIIKKVIKISILNKSIFKEIEIYNFFQSKKIEIAIPYMYDTGRFIFNDKEYQFIIIEKINNSPSIENMIDLNYKIVITIIKETLRTLQKFHQNNYVHGDVKPNNILTSVSYLTDEKELLKYNSVKDKNLTYIYKSFMIDFGFTRKLHENKTSFLGGSLLYMSIDAHNGIISFKSDIESLFYSLFHLIYTDLPWIDYVPIYSSSEKDFNKEVEKVLLEKKKLFKMFTKPQAKNKYYYNILQLGFYVNSLESYETPNYDLIEYWLNELEKEILKKKENN